MGFWHRCPACGGYHLEGDDTDELFTEMVAFIQLIDFSQGLEGDIFNKLGGWNRTIDKVNSILDKLKAAEKGL